MARKKRTLKELEERALSCDEVFLDDLREMLYAKKLNEPIDAKIAVHVTSCRCCQECISLLKCTDPILNGEDEKKKKVLVTNIRKIKK